ncbi:cupin domain-containing protein [Jatrophihabitans fulvus]
MSSYHKINAAAVELGRGPHPAASPFDRRISESLALTTFAIYQVELPAHQHTVAHHHQDDGAEDAYAVIEGSGWVDVDGESVAVERGDFVSVGVEATRSVHAGADGLVLIAVCTAGPERR